MVISKVMYRRISGMKYALEKVHQSKTILLATGIRKLGLTVHLTSTCWLMYLQSVVVTSRYGVVMGWLQTRSTTTIFDNSSRSVRGEFLRAEVAHNFPCVTGAKLQKLGGVENSGTLRAQSTKLGVNRNYNYGGLLGNRITLYLFS